MIDETDYGGSALYRHFRNKNDLLKAVVYDVLTSVEKLLVDASSDPAVDPTRALATTVLQRRAIGVL